ncbi:hypothetical protein TSUD_106950 [Trifolium subterraneum]|uniref:RNase H type-1 domain-containing protein n=1 Tax=Trifolium subterraneum TaxID=3900 RepID=A0A2Z6MZR8_TRISU|nr:hypothetical protein TSUD_106950 [Trifolium subterraneum]
MLFAILPRRNVVVADSIAWSGTYDGKFSIASAYSMLCNFNDDEWDVVRQQIWQLQVLKRIHSFMCKISGELRQVIGVVYRQWGVIYYGYGATENPIETSEFGRINHGRRLFRKETGLCLILMERADEVVLLDEGAYLEIRVVIGSGASLVTWVGSDTDGSVVGWRLIQEIRRLLVMDWEVRICHSYRESNACVDALANLGCDHESGKRVYEQCPASLSSLLLADVMGITTPRVISP